jgi:5S rRNA maturation endonuclease (ribonuclease M5)
MGGIMITTSITPKEAAFKFAKKHLDDGYQFEALHEYTNTAGNIIYWRIRLKNPDTNDKWIRPMHFDGGKYKIGEPNFLSLKPLYNLSQISKSENNPIFICEGEQCADALIRLSIIATTSGSADSATKADWSVLANQEVIIWPDNDPSGQRYANTVIEHLKLLNCTISVIDITQLNIPEKGDVIDWLKESPEAKKEEIYQLPKLDIDHTKTINAQSEINEKQSQASKIVTFVNERATLFHDLNKNAYAQDNTTKETRRLESREFRDWLVSHFYEETGVSPRDQSIREALFTLSGLARFKGDCHEIFIRVGQYQTNYYLDLGEPGQNRVIEINEFGWRIISDPPIYFLRPENLRALPEPNPDGHINLLWEMANIPTNTQLLVIAWLIECLRPDTPFPVLELIGEQGSAKSTTQKMLRQLCDPNACDLRGAPKTVEDVFVSAGVNWLISYENISHLSPPMQDALCILSTGGGFAKRKLYSDSDETVIDVKRPIILNGISASITAQDLIDRTISIETPIIHERQETSHLWKQYGNSHRSILGGLLNIFCSALKKLPGIKVPKENHARLIEFIRLGMAVAESMGESNINFIHEFNASRQESIARTIDSSPVATALIDYLDKQYQKEIQMPINELFKLVEPFRQHNTDLWPRSAKGFADALRRAAPALRQMGIECRRLGKIGSYIHWYIKKKE